MQVMSDVIASSSVSALVAAAFTWVASRLRLSRLTHSLSTNDWTLAKLRVEQADSQALFQVFAENASDIVVRLDAAGRPLYVSPSCRETLGCAPGDILSHTSFDLIHPDDAGRARAIIATCGAGEPAQDAIWRVRHRDGHYLSMEARCRAFNNGLGTHAMGVVLLLRDVSRRVLAEDHLDEVRTCLEHLAMRDALTGLPNRRCFLETADRLLKESIRVAVLFLDLDRFKPINDVHGHPVGDVILREVGARLTRELSGEPMVARLGDDEFAVLVRVTDGDITVAARARDMIRVVATPFRVGEMSLDVGATIGIAISPRDGTDAASMLRGADIAMAHAKHVGGNCYRFFEARMGEAIAEAEDLKRELRAAISAGEIGPFFQPLVRMADNAMVGFEVLARWEHPGKGVVMPSQFLPLVEEMGLSAAMFASMLTRSCEAARNWPPHLRLSVNISPGELQNEGLPDEVRRIIEQTGFSGDRLEIEITENALIHDSKVARGVLDRLRALGMTVALDDFGTGFSSLYHLRELPFDKIKIDRSFMRALPTDAESARYIAAIVGFGNALGLEVTAEGIEDVMTMRKVRELGCTYGQGYLFGRPMPAHDAARLLTAERWSVLAAE